MKYQICIFLFALLHFSIASSKYWLETNISVHGYNVKLYYYKSININEVFQLVIQADKSSDSEFPEKLKDDDYNGLIRKDDVLVLNTKLLLWFSLTTKKAGRVIRSNGGLLAGIWEIALDKSNKPFFTKINKKTNYIPNLLLPGSSPNSKLFGADVYGGFHHSKAIWGFEYSKEAEITKLTGTDIITSDKGPYSPDRGTFVQFKGLLGNSGKDGGIESNEDSDARKGVIGKTQYKLTYRIPYNRPEIIQEVELTPIKGNFGPITNAYVALHLPGYQGKELYYATAPEMMHKQKLLDMGNPTINKYFRNSAVESTYFYKALKQ